MTTILTAPTAADAGKVYAYDVITGRMIFVDPGAFVVAASDAPQRWKDFADYQCTGTDDHVQINAAIALGKSVKLSPGLFSVGQIPQGAASYFTSILLTNGCKLYGSGMGATTVQLAASTPGNTSTGSPSIMINTQIGPGGDENITVADLTIDGNAANQGSAQHSGLVFMRTRGCSVRRVRVQNCRGTGSSGVNETFHFETALGTDTFYDQCQAVGSAGSTASGFSADQATNVTYANCVARGMSVANGFTHNASRGVVHHGCASYLNGGIGFNDEVSFDVTYDGCVAGGVAATTSWPFTAGQSLGNTGDGFTLNGSTRTQLNGCTAQKNGGTGANWAGTISQCRLVGGTYTDNLYGIGGSATAQAGGLRVSGNPVVATNTNAQYALASGWHGGESAVFNPTVPASGVAFTNNFMLDAMVRVKGGVVQYVAVDGTNVGEISGVFIIPGGHTITLNYTTAPTWFWTLGPIGGGGGYITFDNPTGDIGDLNTGPVGANTRTMMSVNTLTAPRVLTLPAANAVPPGAVLQIVDKAGGVTGTNTWSWARSGSDTINNGTGNVVAVNTAYGNGKVMSDGVSKWTVV